MLRKYQESIENLQTIEIEVVMNSVKVKAPNRIVVLVTICIIKFHCIFIYINNDTQKKYKNTQGSSLTSVIRIKHWFISHDVKECSVHISYRTLSRCQWTEENDNNRVIPEDFHHHYLFYCTRQQFEKDFRSSLIPLECAKGLKIVIFQKWLQGCTRKFDC